jgi:hypothetical protein
MSESQEETNTKRSSSRRVGDSPPLEQFAPLTRHTSHYDVQHIHIQCHRGNVCFTDMLATTTQGCYNQCMCVITETKNLYRMFYRAKLSLRAKIRLSRHTIIYTLCCSWTSRSRSSTACISFSVTDASQQKRGLTAHHQRQYLDLVCRG